MTNGHQSMSESNGLYSLESEMSVLGSMMLSSGAGISVLSKLSPDDFYRPAHRTIYEAMRRLSSRQMPTDDIVLLTEEIGAELESIGGEDYLIQVAEYVPSPANADYYAQTVKGLSVRRKLRFASKKIANLAVECETPEDALSQSMAALTTISEGDDDELADGKMLAQAVSSAMDRAIEGKTFKRVPVPFRGLARLKPHCYAGELIVVGARPGMGKSALGLSFAMRGGSTLLVSAEMTHQEIACRIVQMQTGVSMRELLDVDGDMGRYSKIADAIESMANMGIVVDDGSSITVERIRARAMKMKALGALDLVVVDYLGLLKLPKGNSRYEQVGAACWAMKQLAKELRVPVVLIVQLNRQTEGRSEKRPSLGDIRDSGEIEQHANVILFPYWEGYYKRREELNDLEPAEIIVAKHRNGPCGTVPMAWQGTWARFLDVAN